MHSVVVIVYPGFELLDMSGPVSVFNGANRALTQRGGKPFYVIHIVSARGGMVESSAGVMVKTLPLSSFGDAPVDTLLIVGAETGPVQATMADCDLRDLLPRLTRDAGRFGSVCSGGIILASLGLLDGARVATHWDSYAPFRAHFPKVAVDPDPLFIEDGRIWTSAGVTTGIDMALAMVTRDLDAGVAGDVAQRLILYARRPGYQAQFSPILAAQQRGDGLFTDLIGWIQANLAATLDIPTLAARANLSERSFHRKFTAATGLTPANFVETMRLDAARLLLSRNLSLKEIAGQVGLSPAARLTRVFEQRFGISPRTYREMHRADQADRTQGEQISHPCDR